MTLYNPLTYKNLMIALTAHFKRQPKVRLDALPTIQGPGIYALYYTGSHLAYQKIAKRDKPIYVGKADPAGSRKGGTIDVMEPKLQERLNEHANSIAQAENLILDDFLCRYLTVEPVWIALAERFLIVDFEPVWNLCLEGFGNHAPGGNRVNTKRSLWDTMHPGRAWAVNLPAVKTQDDATKLVQSYFS